MRKQEVRRLAPLKADPGRDAEYLSDVAIYEVEVQGWGQREASEVEVVPHPRSKEKFLMAVVRFDGGEGQQLERPEAVLLNGVGKEPGPGHERRLALMEGHVGKSPRTQAVGREREPVGRLHANRKVAVTACARSPHESGHVAGGVRLCVGLRVALFLPVWFIGGRVCDLV